MLLSLIYFYASCAQHTLASLPGIYTLTVGLIGSVVYDLAGDGPTSGPLLISILHNLILYLTYIPEPKSLPKSKYGLISDQPP